MMENKSLKKNYRYDIAMLRLLCIVIVVYFHAYGMMYASHFSPETRSLYAGIYEYTNQTFLINIAMPMFVFISGFLFGGQLMRKQPVSFGKMLKGKFMRVMVPFFVFAVIFMFTQNAASWKPFYQWTYSHLWFLPMLFWCFMTTWLLRPLIMSDNYWVSVPTVILLLVIMIPGKIIPMYFGLHNLNVWIGWFALGAWFFKHESKMTLQHGYRLLKVIVAVGGLAVFYGAMTLWPQEYGKQTIAGIIATIAAIYALWTLFAWIPWQNLVVTNYLMVASGCSFGIYIFHNWLEAHMVSRTAQRLLPLEEWAQGHTVLFPLMFATTAFILSLGITWVLLKFKIGRKLIG